MERIIGTLAAIGLLGVAATGAVSAAPPTNVTSEQTTIRCEMPTPLGYASIFIEAVEGGAFGSVLMWAPDADPFEELPIITTGGSTTMLDGTALTADFDLITADELAAPAGTARVVATLAPDGPVTDFGTRRIHDGNIMVRQGSSVQLYTVAGTLTVSLVAGGQTTVALENCGGSTFTSTYFGTNPDSWVYSEEQVFVACDWSTALGEISLLAITEDPQTRSEVLIITDTTVLVGMGDPVISASTYQAAHELIDLGPGASVGTATASASLSPAGERITENDWTDPHRIVQVGERLNVDGSLILDVDGAVTELPMDDFACRAGDIRYLVQEKR